jgi:hypothetical protein
MTQPEASDAEKVFDAWMKCNTFIPTENAYHAFNAAWNIQQKRIDELEEALEQAIGMMDAVARRNIKVYDNMFISDSCHRTSDALSKVLSKAALAGTKQVTEEEKE